MKSPYHTAVIAIGLVAACSPIVAATVELNSAFGAVTRPPGAQPVGPVAYTTYINYLIGLSDAGENLPVFIPTSDEGTRSDTGSATYDRFNIAVPAGAPPAVFPVLTSTGPFQTTLGNGWTYAMAIYTIGVSNFEQQTQYFYFWHISDLRGAIDFPLTLGGGSTLRVFSLLNPLPAVPEEGTTCTLLLSTFAIAALLRRRMSLT